MNAPTSFAHCSLNARYRAPHAVDLVARPLPVRAKEASVVSVIAVDITAELGRHEAAEACNVSLTTIKRRLKSGAFPHARQVGLDRAWVIPVRDLADVGLLPANALALPAMPAGSDAAPRSVGAPGQAQLAEATAEIRGLREALAAAKDEIAFLRQIVTGSRAA